MGPKWWKIDQYFDEIPDYRGEFLDKMTFLKAKIFRKYIKDLIWPIYTPNNAPGRFWWHIPANFRKNR